MVASARETVVWLQTGALQRIKRIWTAACCATMNVYTLSASLGCKMSNAAGEYTAGNTYWREHSLPGCFRSCSFFIGRRKNGKINNTHVWRILQAGTHGHCNMLRTISHTFSMVKTQIVAARAAFSPTQFLSFLQPAIDQETGTEHDILIEWRYTSQSRPIFCNRAQNRK